MTQLDEHSQSPRLGPRYHLKKQEIGSLPALPPLAFLTMTEDMVVTGQHRQPGASISGGSFQLKCVSVQRLCEKGDAMIMEETGKIFEKEKEMTKGIAFPTSISINNCECHFSPLKSDQDYILKMTW